MLGQALKKIVTIMFIALIIYAIGYFVYRNEFISKFGADRQGSNDIGLSTDDKGLRFWYDIYRPIRNIESVISGTRFYSDKQVTFGK